MSCWAFPPIFSGKVNAKDKIEAKKIIEQEYGKVFPQRVLQKDIANNEFLLNIQDMTKNSYLHELFEERECQNPECRKNFRRIDLYNDANESYKGTEYCSDDCKEKMYEKNRVEITQDDFNLGSNVPVIYKITNKMTNMCYIGQTIQSFTLRWWQHIKWGNTDCKFHVAMKESKITDWIFEVIEVVNTSQSELDERESHYIRKYDSVRNGYNTVKVNGGLPPDQTKLCGM